MKVKCETISEFSDCIRHEIGLGGSLFGNAIRVSIRSEPLDQDGVRERIWFVATTIVNVNDGSSQYLLTFGQTTGVDYNDATQEKNGTKLAEEMKEFIGEFCESIDCYILPGEIEE